MPDGELRACGFSASKIAALKDLAAKALDGTVPDRTVLLELSDAEIVARLTQVRGIGCWTVEMLLMFQLRRPDVMPVDDFGVRNGFRLAYGLRAMPAPKQLAAYAARWAPYRSAAAWYLWRAVDLAKEGKLPQPAQKVRLPRILKKRKKAKAAKHRKAAAHKAQQTKQRRATSSAASAAPRARSGARTRARPRPARRSRAPAKKK